MKIDGYEIEPLHPGRFDDLVTVLGRSGIGGCWCMYWTHRTSVAWGEGAKGGSDAPNRQAFFQQTQQGPPPGLLAYEDGSPIAWCRVMPRADLPGLANSRYFKTDLDITGVWALACFVVKAGHRGKGMTSTLTKAAIEFVRHQGGTTIEAYPWDTVERRPSSAVYLGMASTFERLGFEVVQRLAPHKPMMRLAV